MSGTQALLPLPPSISSAAASPARTSASPAKGPGSPGPDPGSGASSSASFANWDPASSSWRTFQRLLLGDLAELGYDAEWGVLSAASVGAPHLRRRLFIIAWRPADADRVEVRQQQGRGGWPDGAGAAEPRRDGGAGAVADADKLARQSRGAGDAGKGARGRDAGRGAVRQDVADADRTGLEVEQPRQERDQLPPAERGRGRIRRWSSEPDVGRVAHGIPARVDRLRCLGNAVVPAVAFEVGLRVRAILEENQC